MMNNILDYLDYLYPNPKCELNYNKDYELLIAVMLSAQTTDKSVNKVTEVLFNKYNIYTLYDADIEDIKTIIKSIGTYNKKAKFIKEIARVLVDNYNGSVPNNRKILESMAGIGRKTTNVVLSNLFNVPAIAVDTHVERVSKRLGLVKTNDNVSMIENKLMKKIPKDKWSKFHHQMVLFGRNKCKSINPICEDCKLKDICKKYEK